MSHYYENKFVSDWRQGKLEKSKTMRKRWVTAMEIYFSLIKFAIYSMNSAEFKRLGATESNRSNKPHGPSDLIAGAKATLL